MHGIIFNELRKYANTTFGDRTWEALLAAAGLQGSTYLASRSYPDEQVSALVGAASQATNLEPTQILEGFGEFIAPDLLAMFRSLIRADWRTLDVLENTEETIHKVVRLQVADATPPYLNAERTAPDTVVITYTSPRRLCAVARGITRGVAAHFAEPLQLTEETCMLRGDGSCRIVARVPGNA